MWYSKVTNNLANIPQFITHCEQELEVAKSECRIGGLVEKNIKLLPGSLNNVLINYKKLKQY